MRTSLDSPLNLDAPEDFGAVADRAVTLCCRTPWRLLAIMSVGAILNSAIALFNRFETDRAHAAGWSIGLLISAGVICVLAAQTFVLARLLLSSAGCIDIGFRASSEFVRAYIRFTLRFFASAVIAGLLLLPFFFVWKFELSSLGEKHALTSILLAPFAVASLIGACLGYAWLYQSQVTAAADTSKPFATARRIIWRKHGKLASVVTGAAVGVTPSLPGYVFYEALRSAALTETIVTAVLGQVAYAFGIAVCVARFSKARERGDRPSVAVGFK